MVDRPASVVAEGGALGGGTAEAPGDVAPVTAYATAAAMPIRQSTPTPIPIPIPIDFPFEEPGIHAVSSESQV